MQEKKVNRKVAERNRMLGTKAVIFILFIFSLMSASGCGKKAYVRLPPPERHVTAVSRTGYSIQAGAFSDLQNAVRLVMSLKEKGIDAYYFMHGSGLYKVRFGDFAGREKALKKAADLKDMGVISAFFIVSPNDYAASETKGFSEGRLRRELVRTAESFIGIPYRWGGSSMSGGFDCSGLTSAVYHLNGLSLPRTSREQYGRGAAIKRRELKKGDLVFFATGSGKKVSHVGIYTGKDSFIHAPGRNKDIRQDRISSAYFSKRYVGARRYI